MSFASEAFVWFLFVIVLAMFAAVIVLCVAVVVKDCRQRFRRDAPPSPPEVPTDIVKWVRAIVVANPDETRVWAAEA